MKVWSVRIKEVNNSHIINTSLVGDVDRAFVVDWFGLDQPDVEWYEINCE